MLCCYCYIGGCVHAGPGCGFFGESQADGEGFCGDAHSGHIRAGESHYYCQ